MKRRGSFLTVIVVCSLILVPSVYAAGERMGAMGKECPVKARPMAQELRSVDKLLGHPIMNESDETLGTVTDVIFDAKSGQVAYVVVSTGGLMGMGKTEHVVPFRALTIDAKGRYALNMSHNQFAHAPGRPENLNDPRWSREVHEFYGIAPYWEEERMLPGGQPPNQRQDVPHAME